MLVITASIWSQALGALRQPPHDRERVAYFDGVRRDGAGVVTTLTLPDAEVSRGNFAVSAEEMSRAGRHLREHGLRRLAQLHTHPGAWTGHSPHDDEMAYSQSDGAISIVLPHFAGCVPGLGDCGVHLRERRGWRELDQVQASSTISIVPSLVDLRS